MVLVAVTAVFNRANNLSRATTLARARGMTSLVCRIGRLGEAIWVCTSCAFIPLLYQRLQIAGLAKRGKTVGHISEFA
jgi:hypothetical protein